MQLSNWECNPSSPLYEDTLGSDDFTQARGSHIFSICLLPRLYILRESLRIKFLSLCIFEDLFILFYLNGSLTG